jgi:hypothetical protein
MRKNLNLRTNIALGLIFAFLVNTFGPLPSAQAQEFRLPAPGQMVALSPAFSPAVLKGIKLDPQNPFRFHFFVDRGDSSLSQEELKSESAKLIKYFLASLTIPEKDLWVNLSPYEKDRIVPQEFGQTEMGRDLLAEDYLLKQITASLIYPESQLGKAFWQKVYAQAQAKYGTTSIPINTFNKVWIVPEKAVVYENGGTAFVLENHLKVMLEQDYLAFEKNQRQPGESQPGDMFKTEQQRTCPQAGCQASKALNVEATQGANLTQSNDVNALGSQIVREIVIPALTKEVNEGKNFAQLRQVFYSLILATWYKKKIKDSILNKVYSNQNKIGGVNVSAGAKDRIYQEYLKAFKKGVYNYIKEDPTPDGQVVPRKYFSGGVQIAGLIQPSIRYEKNINRAQLADVVQAGSRIFGVDGDVAMTSQASNPPKVELSELAKKALYVAYLGRTPRRHEDSDTVGLMDRLGGIQSGQKILSVGPGSQMGHLIFASSLGAQVDINQPEYYGTILMNQVNELESSLEDRVLWTKTKLNDQRIVDDINKINVRKYPESIQYAGIPSSEYDEVVLLNVLDGVKRDESSEIARHVLRVIKDGGIIFLSAIAWSVYESKEILDSAAKDFNGSLTQIDQEGGVIALRVNKKTEADQAMTTGNYDRLDPFWLGEIEAIDITQELGQANVKSGMFPGDFKFERNGFQPGPITMGIGRGLDGDTVVMRRSDAEGLQKIILARRRNGELVKSATWIKLGGDWIIERDYLMAKFWSGLIDNVDVTIELGYGVIDGRFPVGFRFERTGFQPFQLYIGIGKGMYGDKIIMRRSETEGFKKVIFERWRNGELIKSAAWAKTAVFVIGHNVWKKDSAMNATDQTTMSSQLINIDSEFDLQRDTLSLLTDAETNELIDQFGSDKYSITSALRAIDRTLGNSYGFSKNIMKIVDVDQKDLIRKDFERTIQAKIGRKQEITIYQIGIGREPLEIREIFEALNAAFQNSGISEKDQKNWKINYIAVDVKAVILENFRRTFKIKTFFQLNFLAARADTLDVVAMRQLGDKYKAEYIFHRNTTYANFDTSGGLFNLRKGEKINQDQLANILNAYLSIKNVLKYLSGKGTRYILEPVPVNLFPLVLRLPGTTIMRVSDYDATKSFVDPEDINNVGTGIYRIDDRLALGKEGIIKSLIIWDSAQLASDEAMNAEVQRMAQDIVNTVGVPGYHVKNQRLVEVPGSKSFPNIVEQRSIKREIEIRVSGMLRSKIEDRYPGRSDEILKAVNINVIYRGMDRGEAKFAAQLFVNAAKTARDGAMNSSRRNFLKGVTATLLLGSIMGDKRVLVAPKQGPIISPKITIPDIPVKKATVETPQIPQDDKIAGVKYIEVNNYRFSLVDDVLSVENTSDKVWSAKLNLKTGELDRPSQDPEMPWDALWEFDLKNDMLTPLKAAKASLKGAKNKKKANVLGNYVKTLEDIRDQISNSTIDVPTDKKDEKGNMENDPKAHDYRFILFNNILRIMDMYRPKWKEWSVNVHLDTGEIDAFWDGSHYKPGEETYNNVVEYNVLRPLNISKARLDANNDAANARRLEVYINSIENIRHQGSKKKISTNEIPRAPGGIDLNPAQMSMQVKKEGEDFKFNFNGTEIDAAQVTGATFIIRTMTPVTNLPLILGLSAKQSQTG